MSEPTKSSYAYVRKFAFRPFDGTRRGRFYRVWAVAWQWWIHEWRRSKAVKFLIGFLIFTFVIMNMFLLFTKDAMLAMNPDLTTNDLLKDNLLTMVRGIVSFGISFFVETGDGGSDEFNFGGSSIFILILLVMVGSGLIADDVSNQTTEIYYSKLERHEYVLGKFLAFFIFGNVILTLPYIFEFFLLVVGLGNIDLISALPVLVGVIVFTEIITITYSAIILAFSSLTNRRLYAGLTTFMLIFTSNVIISSLAFSGGSAGYEIFFDVLTLLLLTSYILTGTTTVEYFSFRGLQSLNLTDGVGIESWMVLGVLGLYILFGFLIVVYQVFWRHSK
ncbi:MAG: ABC transporter permease subunit [Candidatus Hodarchaeales archaeon]|jgi:ABC-type transport system involved in multi-copper enzyme maturation permease subunit